MNSTINLSFRYTQSDYVRALRAHYATQLRLPLDVLVILVLIGVGACFWRSPDLHWLAAGSVGLAAGFALMLIAAFTVIPALAFRREPKFRDEYSLASSRRRVHRCKPLEPRPGGGFSRRISQAQRFNQDDGGDEASRHHKRYDAHGAIAIPRVNDGDKQMTTTPTAWSGREPAFYATPNSRISGGCLAWLSADHSAV